MDSLNTRETLLRRIASNHSEESWEDFVYYYEEKSPEEITKNPLIAHDSIIFN